jgi:hypothetical protein
VARAHRAPVPRRDDTGGSACRRGKPRSNDRRARFCEANFFAGELALQQDSKEEAARLFGLAETDCPKNFIELTATKAELKAFGINP